MHFKKQHVFFAIFLGTMISFGTFTSPPSIQSPGGRGAGAERKKKMRFEKNHVWFRFLGDFWLRQVLGNAEVVVFFRKIKRDLPMTSPQKGLVAGCLFFGGRGFGKKLNQKIFLPNGVREKEKTEL